MVVGLAAGGTCRDMRLHHFFGSAFDRVVCMYGSRAGRRDTQAETCTCITLLVLSLLGLCGRIAHRDLQRHAPAWFC